MSPITWPANTTEITDEIRSAIGRTVVFYSEIKSDCPACSIDPITDTSTNSFCPTCSGIGYLITYSGTELIAHVTWGYSEQLGWVSGGTMDEGDCRVQIKYTIANQTVVDNTSYLVVDNRQLEIKKRTLRGVPAVNRILIDCIEKERE